MILLLCASILAVCGQIQCESLADRFLDRVLSQPLERAIQTLNLDPASLPDFSIPFYINLRFMLLPGRVEFSDGVLNGVSRVRRMMQCDGPIVSLRLVKMECRMVFNGMDAVYNGRIKIGTWMPSVPFQITGYANKTIIRSVISGSPTNLDGELKLFDIEELGDVNVRFSNLGFLQPLYNYFEEKLRDRIREEVKDMILSRFPAAFRGALREIALPGL